MTTKIPKLWIERDKTTKLIRDYHALIEERDLIIKKGITTNRLLIIRDLLRKNEHERHLNLISSSSSMKEPRRYEW